MLHELSGEKSLRNVDAGNIRWKFTEEKPVNFGKMLSLKIQSEEEVPGIIRQIVGNGGNIYEVKISRPSLEDIYFSLTAKGKEEQP